MFRRTTDNIGISHPEIAVADKCGTCYGEDMTKTYEQRALEAKIRGRITFGWRNMGMAEWQTIESVDISGLAEDIIAWADIREKRHGSKT